MGELKNLEEILEMLNAWEQMQDILEKQQDEIEELLSKNRRLKEQLDESMSLNEQLTAQVKRLNGQNQKLMEQIRELKS